MTELPDLFAFVIQLHPADRSILRAQGHGAQALFLNLVRQVDPATAELLHADTPSKPYTIALLPQQRDRQMIELRVSLLRAELFQTFVQALLRQSPGAATLRLGQTSLRLGDVIGTPPPTGHPWAGYSSFAELSSRALPAATISLEFASATAIGQGARPDGRQRLAILPDPNLIFPSLARRWNELAPSPYSLDFEAIRTAASDTLITRYQSESVEISLGKGPQKGFIGSVTYESPAQPEQSRLLSLLAHAALFLGVGMKTARGMGLCRRVGGAA